MPHYILFIYLIAVFYTYFVLFIKRKIFLLFSLNCIRFSEKLTHHPKANCGDKTQENFVQSYKLNEKIWNIVCVYSMCLNIYIICMHSCIHTGKITN